MTNEKVIEILNTLAWNQGGPNREEIIEAISIAIALLENNERPHGSWKPTIKFIQFTCSKCGAAYSSDYNYCPNCGAAMDIFE